MEDVVIVSGVRTAIGRYGGGFVDTPAADLGAAVIKESVSRAGIEPEQVDDAVMADQFVAFGEGDVLIRQGVNLKFTYGFHNRDVDVDEDERIRARIGLELFPIPYLQVSGFFTLRDDIPANLRQALPQKDQVSIELHLFF